MILGIYGSGGLGREVLDTVIEIEKDGNVWEKIVFINDGKKELRVNNRDVLTFDEFKLNYSPSSARVAIAVGEPVDRKELRERVENDGYSLQTIVHPKSVIGFEAELGDGLITQCGSVISCNTKVGHNVLLQQNVYLGHDSTVGTDTVVSPLAAISGSCTIGECTYIGTGASVKERLSIGSSSIVGMGSVVLRDIPCRVIAFGNPATVIKKNEHGKVFKNR